VALEQAASLADVRLNPMEVSALLEEFRRRLTPCERKHLQELMPSADGEGDVGNPTEPAAGRVGGDGGIPAEPGEAGQEAAAAARHSRLTYRIIQKRKAFTQGE
jgi:hypothetical protein